MRRRRAGRCLLRADLAIDDGCTADARRAIEEARQLDPDCPNLAQLEARLDSLNSFPLESPDGTHGCHTPSVQAGEVASITSLPQSWRWVGSSAFVVILLSGTAVASYSYWRASAPRPAATRTATPSLPALRVEQETVKAPAVAPDLLGADIPTDDPTLPPLPMPPIAEVTIPQAGEAIVLAVNRGTLPSAPAVPEAPRSEANLDELPGAPSPSPQAPARISSPSPTVTAVAEPADSATSPVVPAAKPEPKPVDESQIVRGVLSKYERAYSSLDASAASAVWPGVDRRELARAFQGLASQRVSLKSCDVTVNGAAARAQCSGTATWVPKVGGGVRTAARQWEFELRKRDGDWEIERAVAR